MSSAHVAVARGGARPAPPARGARGGGTRAHGAAAAAARATSATAARRAVALPLLALARAVGVLGAAADAALGPLLRRRAAGATAAAVRAAPLPPPPRRRLLARPRGCAPPRRRRRGALRSLLARRGTLRLERGGLVPGVALTARGLPARLAILLLLPPYALPALRREAQALLHVLLNLRREPLRARDRRLLHLALRAALLRLGALLLLPQPQLLGVRNATRRLRRRVARARRASRRPRRRREVLLHRDGTLVRRCGDGTRRGRRRGLMRGRRRGRDRGGGRRSRGDRGCRRRRRTPHGRRRCRRGHATAAVRALKLREPRKQLRFGDRPRPQVCQQRAELGGCHVECDAPDVRPRGAVASFYFLFHVIFLFSGLGSF